MKWPSGFKSAGLACGIKADGSPDCALLVADRPGAWAGVFTQNAAAAAPVRASKERLGGPVKAVIVNSGNANACTGSAGDAATRASIEATAAALDCSTQEVVVASTGPIGVQLPTAKLLGAIPSLTEALTDDAGSFASAILTTDTVTKLSSAGGACEVRGVAKGAAMLAPNMATMLAFVTSDAALDEDRLTEIVTRVVGRTFNRICVDACESTNDSVFVLTSGLVPVSAEEFEAALERTCADLAEQMVKDAEGGSHLVRIRVVGAPSEQEAAALGKSVASSALWRAAVHGADPNWGRILSALGTSRSLDISKVSLQIGNEVLFTGGGPVGDPTVAAIEMKEPSYEVICTVGDGSGEAVVLTSDLSPAYVELNAGGTT